MVVTLEMSYKPCFMDIKRGLKAAEEITKHISKTLGKCAPVYVETLGKCISVCMYAKPL